VLRLRDDLAIVQTVDFFAPVVDDPYEYGAIAAANSMSDIFAMGGTVTMGLNIAAFPDDLDLAILSEIFRGGSDKMQEAGGVVVGGHTVTDDEPKYGIAVTGTIHPKRVWTKAGAQPGDALFLTKPLGTGVLTTAAKQDRITQEQLQPAIGQMMRLNLHARNVAERFSIHASTDITGFGLAGHAWEMSDRSGVLLQIDLGSLPVLSHARELIDAGVMAGGLHRNRDHFTTLPDGVEIQVGVDSFGAAITFDPQTSGGLLLSVAAGEANDLEAAFADAGEPIWRIGKVEAGSGVQLSRDRVI
jgi:selenide,water dikinase